METKAAAEWFKQAAYDIKSAETLFLKKQYIHCVFFCHLALEKTLKGIYVKKKGELPARTHNLLYFVEKLELKPEKEMDDFLTDLNSMSIPTRYPDSLAKMAKVFTRKRTKEMLDKSKGALKWAESLI
ncbi:MAG: HEPN domain protein [Candidatus Aerophobetes bacterium ADurb.Bin490]|nr:MAG: HEPN domain protein [Candidatus Aerophobetes bacterium ADurb.Bin490]HNZ28570.1 HEPN domain-containing protein [Candidatus Goldiibacteriota bacterium]HPI03053.1 HEPN domain-containing protein [Candidatus Goldiibacteriota bacterium]HPN64336.1 HEPN domain-containing protein [Candidatus Goldiibacteriota bacterium]HRQ44356.1 HEPN domain-containing protein [Candidatus Goldiibacteriota bacterium]